MVGELQPGDPQRAGPYELTGVLGGGGMGRVFLGRSVGGRPVAVKVIRADLAANPEFRARFRREVAAARQVNGLFTAGVVDADADGLMPWLATVYVAGPSLEQAVAEHGPLPAEAVKALAAGLAEGLAAIHAAGVVHRDLKPSNVLLAADGPRVIDFGISRAAETGALTQTGLVIGSPGFMSPEQAEGGEVGPPSDVFSLGAVLAFAASGQGPFGTGLTAALVYRVVHSPPSLEKVPEEIRSLVERCLAKDPAQRPAASDILHETGTAQPAPGWLPEPVIGAFTKDAWPGPAAGMHTVTAAKPPAAPAPVPVQLKQESRAPAERASRDRRRPWRSRALMWTAAGLLAASAAVAFALTTTGHGSTGTYQRPQTGVAVTASSAIPRSAASATARSSASPSAIPGTTAPAPAITSAPAPVARVTSVQQPSPAPTTQAPTTQAPTTPAPAATVLGGVDLQAYCQSLGYSSVELVQNNAYGWRCVASNGSTSSIDVIAACRAEYKDPAAKAYYSNYDNPDSWYCTSS